MKYLNITLFSLVIVFLACSLSTVFAQEDGPAVKRIGLRRPAGKAIGKATTSTTSAPTQDAEDGEYPEENADHQYDDEDYPESQSSTTSTTTETPKKIGPVIRPFRTNDDFLNSLKRRQMDAKKHRSEKPTPKSKPAPTADEESGEEAEEPPKPKAAPTKSFKGNPALNRRKPIKPVKSEPTVEDAEAEESEQSNQESKLKRPNPRLSLRRRA